jgi:hypothetical protein
MRREFVHIDDIDVYSKNELAGKSGFHFPDEHGNLVRVDKKRDGKSLEDHLEGIEYLTGIARAGTKIFPPLVLRQPWGRFKKLDGFKRLVAMRAAGLHLIECFVCEKDDLGHDYNVDGIRMRAGPGGQGYGRFKRAVEYGESQHNQKKGGKIINLFVGKGLKIEYRENIHIHWGPNRLALGRKDFDLLAEALSHGESE